MMKTSTQRLSDVARHIVKPSGIVKTSWPAVAKKISDMAEAFDPWQVGAAKLILAKRADGTYAASIGGVVISIPRQVGKTFMIGMIVFALCLLHPGLTVLWTAHRLKTANETFRSMQGLAKRRRIAPLIEQVRQGSGDQVVLFKNGSRVLFGAREEGFGLGFAQVDIVVLDEAQRLTEKALDDMVPATNQSRMPGGALIVMTGTPPRPTDQGDVFRARREEALSGESDDLLYIELAADPKTDPSKWAPGYVDWEQVGRANPSFPDRTPRAAILRMFKQLGKSSFRREGLGIWDAGPGTKATIPAPKWGALAVPLAPPDGVPAFGVKFDLTGERVAVAAAVADGDEVTVEVVGMHATAAGLDDLKEWLAGRARQSLVVVDGKSGASGLVAGLPKSRRISLATAADAIEAHQQVLDLVNAGRLHHTGQPGLTASVAASTKRKIGTAGGWGWQAIGDGDSLPLEAATLAAWAASKNIRTRTESGQRKGRRVVTWT